MVEKTSIALTYDVKMSFDDTKFQLKKDLTPAQRRHLNNSEFIKSICAFARENIEDFAKYYLDNLSKSIE